MVDITKLIQSYERFVPHEILDLLNKNDITEVQLGDQVEQRVTILFTDVRNFTTLSEQLSPQENFHFINSYLSQMEPIISGNNGIIDKYIGDAIMAIFPHSPDDAYNCSIQMLEQLKKYNAERMASEQEPIRIGIGLNTGLAMIGIVGGNNRLEGTVISDAVNLCARIEALTKTYGLDLMIGEGTYHNLHHENKEDIRFIDRVLVKGKFKPQSIYEVFAGDEPSVKEKKRASKQVFEEALANYHYSNIDISRKLLEECLAQNKDDVAAQIYLKRCENYLSTGVLEGSSELADRISWGEHFLLHHEVIDGHHHDLVECSLALIEGIENDIDTATEQEMLKNIEDLAKSHFRVEETILHNINYPLLDYHKQQHHVFLSSFAAIIEELAEPSLSKIYRMFKVQVFLIDWLVNHTLKEDRNYLKYLPE